MFRPATVCRLVLLVLPLTLLGACPGVSITVPGGTIEIPDTTIVTLELYNDTDFEVDPHIVYDDDSGFWARLAPAEELGVHSLAPGDSYVLDIDCDQLGLVLSDEPEQFIGPFSYSAPASRIVEREHEYDCGDVVQFQFLGTADSFDVIVSVNGVVVD
jgi:hypothetical protein